MKCSSSFQQFLRPPFSQPLLLPLLSSFSPETPHETLPIVHPQQGGELKGIYTLTIRINYQLSIQYMHIVHTSYSQSTIPAIPHHIYNICFYSKNKTKLGKKSQQGWEVYFPVYLKSFYVSDLGFQGVGVQTLLTPFIGNSKTYFPQTNECLVSNVSKKEYMSSFSLNPIVYCPPCALLIRKEVEITHLYCLQFPDILQ